MPPQDRKIYVTTMYRHGDRNLYSYPLYAGFIKARAIAAGKAEHRYRGHNYVPEVVVFIADDPGSRKVVFTMLDDRKPEEDGDED